MERQQGGICEKNDILNLINAKIKFNIEYKAVHVQGERERLHC